MNANTTTIVLVSFFGIDVLVLLALVISAIIGALKARRARRHG